MSTLCQTLALVALFFSLASGMSGDHNKADSDFCIHYYGAIQPQVEVSPQSAGLNQSADICRSVLRDGLAWTLSATSGVVLAMCPISKWANNTDGAIMTISLQRRAPLYMDESMKDITFQDVLITNNSRHGPFEGGRVPGNVSHAGILSRWDIDGTQAALDPSADARVKLDCPKQPQHTAQHGYCLDLNKTTFRSSEACFPYQLISWTKGTALNFSIDFGNIQAIVRLEMEAKWSLDGTQAKTVSSTTTLLFIGQRDFPSVVDYDFWKNTTVTYESMIESHTSIEWIRDSNGWPAFYNRSNRAWYAAMNQTFGKWEGSGTKMPPSLLFLFGALLLPFVL